jgi:hypothetical protein
MSEEQDEEIKQLKALVEKLELIIKAIEGKAYDEMREILEEKRWK